MSRPKTSKTKFCLPEELGSLSRRSLIQTGTSLTAWIAADKLFRSGLRAQTQESYPPQRSLIWINMNGGWDILEVLDPKVSSTSGIDMSYSWAEANRVSGAADDVRVGRWLPNIAGIGDDLLLLRGMAMGTTSHQAGRIYMETGILSNAGRVNSASIPAIVASESSATIPIIQLGGGGEPMTDRGLLKPVSVVRANNLSLYRSMYPESTTDRERSLALLDYLSNSLAESQQRAGESDRLIELSSAEQKVRTQFENDVGSRLQLTDADRQAFLNGAPAGAQSLADSFALASKLIKNDLVTCVNLGVGGFDTHSNQTARLQPILARVDFLVRTLVDDLRAAGRLDQTLIVLYSDFGRTPRVNNSNGRDHWPVGGAMMIGGGIQGGRVVGATDDDFRALSIEAESGAVSSSGVQLNPTHLGGAVLELTLGTGYSQYRPYLESIAALTRLKNGT